jgi:hypothetical protein
MAVLMILCGDALGRPTGFDGQFLKAFDFEAHGGVGLIDMTLDLQQALKFADLAEAVAFWKRSPKCQPTRPDGRPNRPLTATNWEFRTI